ncbi:MAG: hypothetical protein VB134_01510, partial [[Clostridium] symbiosum]|nr:hypothetical protein [[Clostridium] symbiosum]
QKEVQFNDAIAEMKKRAEVDFLSGLLNRSELKIRIQDFFNHNQEFTVLREICCASFLKKRPE